MGIDFYGPHTQVDHNHYHLNKFHNSIQSARRLKSTEYILLWLKDMAKVNITWRTKTYAKARKTRKLFRTRLSRLPLECFACFKHFGKEEYGKRFIIHHIILIKNGGLDITKNRILLCQECHSKVHDWLKE